MAKPVLIDTHCHIDQYTDPLQIIRTLDAKKVIAVAVTNSPSAFLRCRQRFAQERYLRLALGVHPLHAAALSESEWLLFHRFLHETRYIGEVGLDFSPEGIPTQWEQVEAFRRVLEAVTGQQKILSVHSRRAEEVVLQVLQEFAIQSVIFHWYSGPLRTLDRLLEANHYCSFNPAMTRSEHGQKIIAHTPKERVLVETDGPHVRIGNRPAMPSDSEVVYSYLSRSWKQSFSSVVEHVYNNFLTLTALS